MFNPFNFASDLMEPFRTIVDRKVTDMMPEKFEHEEKMQVVDVLTKYVRIAGRKETVLNAIKIYTKSVFDALEDQDISIIRLYKNEF